MKSQISCVDLHFLIKELSFLERGRVDKIYHPNKEELVFSFHVTSKGKQMLRIIAGKYLFLTSKRGAAGEPGGFCMFLRKHLDNSRVASVTQIGSERIACIDFESKTGLLHLYIELFGKGNVVLCDENNVILNALYQQHWSDRKVQKSQQYVFPKKTENIFTIKKDAFSKLIGSDKEIVMQLAKDLGMGGAYAEEVCSRAGIDKKTMKVSAKEKELLYSCFQQLLNEKLSSQVISKEGKIKDIIPFSLSKYAKADSESFATLNSAYDHAYQSDHKEEFVSKHQKQIDKETAIIDAQQKQINKLEKKSSDLNRKGELLYEHYQTVSEILSEITKARSKFSFKEIKEKLKGHKIVKNIDEKNKKITIDL